MNIKSNIQSYNKKVLFYILVRKYDVSSVTRAKQFILRCREYLRDGSKLLWISFQSNILVDTDMVDNKFKSALDEMKEELVKSGWIIPVLRYNMRNQINISNIVVDGDDNSFKMQGAIEKTTSGSTILGNPRCCLMARIWSFMWFVANTMTLKSPFYCD